MKAYLLMEDGELLTGEAFGSPNDAMCELVFNTSMIGYVETLTDPAYAGQGIVMTYPMIGNYGMAIADCEAAKPWIKAIVVHQLARYASNFRMDTSLAAYLNYHGIPGIQGLDTRQLTRRLRVKGTMNAFITRNPRYVLGNEREKILTLLRTKNMTQQVVDEVSNESGSYPAGDGPKIALLDFGAKKSIGLHLAKRGARVRVFRYNSSAEEIIESGAEGVLLSSGPGDPLNCSAAFENVQKLCKRGLPMMAICLGHQILALANGATTRKMRFGHRGANHPVRDAVTGRVVITAQSHGYVIEEPPPNAVISHVNVNDGSCEGLRYDTGRIISVQFHPEANGGPRDSEYLFDEFMQMIQKS